ncbi:MAG: hypothetical protein ACFE85_05335 [Candidatus Hodarchaeota archaeon]
MYVHGDYEEILENCLVENLEWLIEEFNVLFSFKNHKFNQRDIKLANQLIDFCIETVEPSDNKKILNNLSETLKVLARNYPEFFQ